ncbi:MAG: pyridoxamine 5'-phosphate oxidase family protein [Chloroflexota bacterium]
MTDGQLGQANQIYQHLLDSQQSVILATMSEDGSPLSSYAPCAVDSNKNFYIFVSALSQHTGNLIRHQQASLMLIADEADSSQIFARERLIFQCKVSLIERDSDVWAISSKLYGERFADMFPLLSSLSDFSMVQLTPTSGQLIVGFGQAYNIGADLTTLNHRNPRANT